MTDDYSPDSFNRTALLLAHELGDAVDGVSCHDESHISIIAGPGVCATRSGHAALLTAVKTAVRAFGQVRVALHDPAAKVLGGPDAGVSLASVVTGEGARLEEFGELASDDCVVVLGECPEGVSARPAWLTASWTGWTALVAPTVDATQEQAPTNGNELAAIAAGALLVAERFFMLLPGSETVVGRRVAKVDLWAPIEHDFGAPPDLAHAPAHWWLLGLGHLGQGYAHAISWLDFAVPSEVQVVLQDAETTVMANHSTGVLTPAGSVGERKTRVTAASLDKCGYQTVIVERRMTRLTPAGSEDMHVALVGVDNLATRRGIDDYNWRTAIDVGIGSGAHDFDGMTIIRFPGRPSGEIPAWQERPGQSVPGPLPSAPGLDACGLTELNGIAVGASFIGAIAGALAVAEACRPLHGGVGHAIQCRELRSGETEMVAARAVSAPISVPLTSSRAHSQPPRREPA